MLRVGLTGGLGSGKSTVAARLEQLGARVLSADELGRSLMQPGTPVFDAIVSRFGPSVVLPDGQLNRPELARLAFAGGRVEELNAIVHPATIALQQQRAEAIFAANPRAIVVVESALLFETRHGEGWRQRFDAVILVTAPEEAKIARFIARSGSGDPAALAEEARRRLARMIPDAEKAAECDFVVQNDGDLKHLGRQVDELWEKLKDQSLTQRAPRTARRSRRTS